jgi:phosphoribosyl-AMP cyclohydrolase
MVRFKYRSMTMTFLNQTGLTHDEIDEGTVFAPRFDANGLLTAVAVDAGDGRVLMVGHVNAEALARTLETGEVHYWSRSRNKLWKKGETSGEIQRLVEMRADCDQDVVLLTVEQTGRGAACHTGRQSCFYRRVVVDGDAARLEDTGAPRLFDPKEVYGG